MPRILVIDDDDQVRLMLQIALEKSGFEVLTAENGKIGLAMFREQSADLIVTDIIMPEQEGIETIVELRRDFPDTKIIAISGGGKVSPESYLTMADALGASRTFSKPLDMDEFLEAVQKLLDIEDQS
jgi:DNA-binding response OmpR family regulator